MKVKWTYRWFAELYIKLEHSLRRYNCFPKVHNRQFSARRRAYCWCSQSAKPWLVLQKKKKNFRCWYNTNISCGKKSTGKLYVLYCSNYCLNTLKIKLIYTYYWKSIRTSQRIQWASNIKSNQLFLCREIIDVYHKKCTKHIVMKRW